MDEKKHNAKIAQLNKLIEEKDDTLASQDVEILKQKVELDVLAGKLAAKNLPTNDCVVETVKYDVGTNTPVNSIILSEIHLDLGLYLIFNSKEYLFLANV